MWSSYACVRVCMSGSGRTERGLEALEAHDTKVSLVGTWTLFSRAIHIMPDPSNNTQQSGLFVQT